MYIIVKEFVIFEYDWIFILFLIVWNLKVGLERSVKYIMFVLLFWGIFLNDDVRFKYGDNWGLKSELGFRFFFIKMVEMMKWDVIK